jgi:hypothetical protein
MNSARRTLGRMADRARKKNAGAGPAFGREAASFESLAQDSIDSAAGTIPQDIGVLFCFGAWSSAFTGRL